jgi:hypothetical protein
MKKTTQSGFGKLTVIVLVAAAAAAYYFKDEQGVRYVEKGYAVGYDLFFGRHQDALNKAKDVRSLMQKNEDNLQTELDL